MDPFQGLEIWNKPDENDASKAAGQLDDTEAEPQPANQEQSASTLDTSVDPPPSTKLSTPAQRFQHAFAALHQQEESLSQPTTQPLPRQSETSEIDDNEQQQQQQKEQVMNVDDVAENGSVLPVVDRTETTAQAKEIDLTGGEDNRTETTAQSMEIDLTGDEGTVPTEADPVIGKVKDWAPSPVDPKREERRERKRRIRRLLRPGVIPSFIAIIAPDYDEEKVEAMPQKRIKVDVNAYLGLKRAPSPHPVTARSSAVGHVLPADEGYYEGAVPLSMPEDIHHLNELHILIRAQLELFSATEDDVRTTQAGRRTRTVRGRVGLRCIHCAKAALSTPAATRVWPNASISYPINIAGIYAAAGQKPTLHFANCPYMPQDTKSQIYRLTQVGDARRTRKASGGTQPISTVLYYAMSCKRIGLVDVDGSMRFGRDLTLQPLPLESIRAQVEQNANSYRRNQPAGTAPALKAAPSTFVPQSRIKADAESESVLAQALVEKDDPKMLGRSDDSKLVSDFIFLCIRSMAICHAMPFDLETRGKKTSNMRLGYAGFCCRFCYEMNNPETSFVPDYSCRSFTSAADNIAAAISNAYSGHFTKCQFIPSKLRAALAAYKRIHSKQMGRLPHGSQRRLFHALWDRLRAADISVEEMQERIKNLPVLPDVPQLQQLPVPAPVPSGASVPDAVASTGSVVAGEVRMPVCDDPETLQILKAAEEQDPSECDGIILSSDRHLVTDYVFLIMKQLKFAHPTALDFARGRRATISNTQQAGMCCRYCATTNGPVTTASGRSFPSHPDNMSSSLSCSLYQHLQRCARVPAETKRALVNVKRIHPEQLACIPFGSQRKYFNRVFERLRSVEIDFDINDLKVKAERGTFKPTTDDIISEHNFFQITDSCFECQLCRMVPLTLRAPYSVALERPTPYYMNAHARGCKGDSFDLTGVVDSILQITKKYPAFEPEMMVQPEFQVVVSVLCGGNERLVNAFTNRTLELIKRHDKRTDDGNTQSIDADLKGLWHLFPVIVEFQDLQEHFQAFASEVPGLEPDLTKNKEILRYLQLISPAFTVQAKPKQG